MIALKFLCVGDKLMMEMHLRQPGFMYSACGPFTKYKKKYKNYIHQNELDKACF